MEKLFVQIFEKKRCIIEHLKQQKQLYDQHLASKLLIQGIPPPSWLLNPEFPSLALDFTAIIKEELISELLLQRPGPLVSYPGGTCFSYDKSVATAVNDEPPHETCAKTCASSNGSEGNEPSIVPSYHINGIEDGTDILPPCYGDGTEDMLNYVPMSPEDQINTTNSNTYLKLEESLARMQRSRSRQKALEFRNSGRASGKSCLGNEKSVGIPSGNKAFGYDQPLDDIRRTVELIGPSALSAGINEEAALGDCSGKETRSDACSDSSSQSKGNGLKEAQTEDDDKMEWNNNLHGGRNTRSGSFCPQSIVGSHKNNRKSHDVYVGRMTRSRSGKVQLAEVDNPTNRRITRSRSCHPANQNGVVMNSNLNSVRITKSRSCGAKDAETKDQRSRNKNDMLVKPKQLDFDDFEETCLADIPTDDKGNLEENTRACYIKEKCDSLPRASSSERTSNKYKSLAHETQDVLEIEVYHSPPKTYRMSVQTSSLVDYLPNSPGTQEHMHGITMECAAEPSFSRPNTNIGKGLSAQKHTFEPEEGQELNKDASCLSLPNVDTKATMSLHRDNVEVTLSLEKARHELSSSNDCKETTYLSLPIAVEPTMSLHREAVEATLISVKTTHEASCESNCKVTLSLPNGDTEATMSLNRDAVDTTLSPNQSRLESSPGNDVKAPLETQIQLSPHRTSAGSLSSMLNFLPVNSSDETRSEHTSEMLKSGNQFRNTDEQTSCFSSHVEVVGSKLPEGQEGVDILPEYNLSNAMDGSWPCYKRRKIGYQVDYNSASPSARVHTFPGVNRSFSNKSLDCVKDNSSPISRKFIISQGSDAMSISDFVATANGIKYLDSIELELAPKMQHEESKVTLEGSVMMPFACEQKELSSSRVSNVKQDATTELSNCFSEGEEREASTSAVHSSGRLCNELVFAKFNGQGNSIEKLTSTKAILDMKESLQEVEKLKLSISSPLIECMNVDVDEADADADEIVPELEGFIIAEKMESLHNAEDGLKGIIPFLSEQAEFTGLPEQILRPASLSTPVSPFPSAYKPHFTPGVFRSVPNGLIENVDLTSNLISDDYAFHVKSYSDFSIPSKRLDWDTAKPFLSPLVKGFEGIISESGGSNERLSSNPELICFPIQEDPETSEEDVDVNDVSGTGMNGVDPNMKSSLIREPLCNITENNEGILACSQADNRSSFESVTTEISIDEKCGIDKKKSEMHLRSSQARQGKENQSLSIGANSTRKHSESLSSRYSKPKLSGKSSLRSRGQSLLKKESKQSNIVSNVKSFIPLVQQKKATSDVPAKREVKVKALEAAEAAKRVAEKRENERKQKKEALKLERARLEQENLKQMELKKRLKEEERKKRDAENAAKKRQREEGERKEKERKRKRLEDVRCQQKQAEEKIQAWREECQTEDARAHERKDSNDKAAEKEHISRNPVNELAGSDTKEANNAAPSTNDNKSSTGSSDTRKVGIIDVTEISTPNCDKTDKLINQTSQEQSYDISPYQCSDDEEEEEDDIPNKKFIPTWASKSCVAGALSSLKNLDSDTIFPPGSFCSLEEVLLPRRLPQK